MKSKCIAQGRAGLINLFEMCKMLTTARSDTVLVGTQNTCAKKRFT